MKQLKIFLLALAISLSGCGIFSRTEIYLIPEGTIGDVFILPGYPSGVAPKREGFAGIYEIPPSRILVTQDTMSPGWHRTRFYSVDAAGKRQLLEYEPSTIPKTRENLSDHRPVVTSTGGIAEIRSADLPCAIRYQQYYVGTRADFLSRSPDEANEGDRLLRQFVRDHHVCP